MKFKVTMQETVQYEFEVEADSEDDIADAAEEAFVQMDPLPPVTVTERDVIDWEKIDE